jgi:cysteine desulfurase
MDGCPVQKIALFGGCLLGSALLRWRRAASSSSSSGVGTRLEGINEAEFKGCIYLDYNATTPIYPEVAGAMIPYLSRYFANPSSGHVFAEPCRRRLQWCREQTAAVIGAGNAKTIVFTSCGSESDNKAIDIALDNFLYHARGVGGGIPHVVTCKIEHPATICYLRQLKLRGVIELTVVGVNGAGQVDPEVVRTALQPNTALVTIMHSNNEIGTIQPIRSIAEVVRAFNEKQGFDLSGSDRIILHCDAAQSIGKAEVNVASLGVDLLTIVGHKFGAPKGVAALYIAEGLR